MKNTILLLFIFLFFACEKEPNKPSISEKYTGLYIYKNDNNNNDTLMVYSFSKDSKDSLAFKISNQTGILTFTARLYDTSTFFSYNFPKNYKNKVSFRSQYLNEDIYILFDFVKINCSFKNDTFNVYYHNGNSSIEFINRGVTSPYRSEFTTPISIYIKVKN